MELEVVQHSDGTFGLSVDGAEVAEDEGVYSRATPVEVIADAHIVYGGHAEGLTYAAPATTEPPTEPVINPNPIPPAVEGEAQ